MELTMNYDGNRPAKWSEGVWIPRPIRHRHTKLKIEALRLEAKIIAISRRLGMSQQLIEFRHNLTDSQRQQLRNRGYSV